MSRSSAEAVRVGAAQPTVPVIEACSNRDGWVHAVDAVGAGRDEALVDPSRYTTRCAEPVYFLYNTRIEVTCPRCQAVAVAREQPAP